MLLCWFEQISGAHWTVLAHLTRDFHPLRSPPLPATAHGPMGPLQRSGCGWASVSLSWYAGHRPRLATACCARSGGLPNPSLLKAGSWPACSHTALLSDRIPNVSSGPIQFPDCRQPARTRRGGCARADWRRRRNASQFETYFVDNPARCRLWPGLACQAARKDRSPAISLNSSLWRMVSSTQG